MRLNGRGSPTSRTTDWRYWRPYCREKPHVKRVGLNSRSTSTSPSAVDEIFWFRTRDGTAQPKAPVRASGLSSSRPSGRSPNPLPKNTEGVTVSNDSASTFLPPVPPTSQPTPTDRKSTRLNSSHLVISYAVFCLKKKKRSDIHSLYIEAI